MTNLTVAATFTRNTGAPATGLTLADIALYLTAHDKDAGTDTVIWNGTQNPTQEIDNCGTYARIYTDADLEDYDYFARASYNGVVTLDTDHVMGATSGPNPWDYATRTVTQSAAQVAAAVAGSTITLNRGDTLSAALTGLGALTGYVSIDFTVKYLKSDTDDDAVLRIRLNASGTGDGLLRMNGADATARAANGSITIDDSVAGDITIALAAPESDDLAGGSYYYDIQLITSSAVSTLSEATFTVTEDVTRLIT